MSNGAKMLTVYTIVEHVKKELKPIFVKIGVCFTNKDGSFNVYLDALPVNGKLHIREATKKEGT